MTRYRIDGSWQRYGGSVVAGSPLRVFRLTPAGEAVAAAIERGDDVAGSVLVNRLLDAGAIHPRPDPPAVHRFGPGDVTIVTPVHRAVDAVDVATDVGDRAHRRIVVDDASMPPVPGATLRFERNRGPGAARNAGAALVTTPLVALVDADVDVTVGLDAGDTGGWLAELLWHFDDERVGLVAPRVTSHGGRGGPERYERTHSPLDLGDEPARIRSGTRVSYVPAAAVVVRVDALRAVGGFDETLRFGEDVDLVWRLDEAGWVCRYDPDVTVGHVPRATWGEWARQRIGYGSSAAPLSRRHPRALAPARMSGWSAAVWALGAAGHPEAGIALGALTSLALARRLDAVPAPVAMRLAATGNALAGRTLASAVRRAWWPVLLIASTRSRTARRILLASVLAAPHPVRVLDDLSYSVGLWRGVWRERTLDPLLPRFSSWPGRPAARRGGR